jgi:hypothetical protein
MDEGFHLGSYLTKLIEVKKLKRSDITRAMEVQYSAFYGYENRPSLQYSIIMRLCHAMKYNLFWDIASTLPADYEHNKVASSEKDTLIAQLEEENKKLKWENDLLKEMILKKG